MSDTHKCHKRCGSIDLWGKRPLAGELKTAYNKRRCRKIERRRAHMDMAADTKTHTNLCQRTGH